MRLQVATLLLLCAAAQAVEWVNVRPISVNLPVSENTPRLSPRIVGGGMATAGQFPYQVGVIVDLVGICGASLLSSTTVLTAAHCVYQHNQFEVHLGAHYIFNSAEPNHRVVQASSWIMHSGWDPAVLNHDIAILRIPATTGTAIAPVALPRRADVNTNVTGSTGTVTGWGLTSQGGLQSDSLKWAQVPVVSNWECEFLYGEFVITPDKLCTATSGGAAAVCNGDSGGPLVLNNVGGKTRQFGVVSFGSSRGCQSGDPQGFTRVGSYLDWIRGNSDVSIEN